MSLTVDYVKNRNNGVNVIVYNGQKIVSTGFCPYGPNFSQDLERITDTLIANSMDDNTIDSIIAANKIRING